MDGIYQTPTEIVAEIIMSEDSRPCLIVEGLSDEKLFRGREFADQLRVWIGRGWEGVVAVIEGFKEKISDKKVIGLIDKDYHEHIGKEILHEEIVKTDLRDIENILFNSSALNKVVIERCSREKLPVNPEGSIDYSKIRKRIYKEAVKIGKFRIFCLQNSLNISMDSMDHSKFICNKTLVFSEKDFISHLAGKNQGVGFEKWYFPESMKLNWDADSLNDDCYVSNGHDVMSIMCVAMRRIWGSGNACNREDLEQLFRVGFSDEEFRATNMWKCIEKKCFGNNEDISILSA